MRSNQNAMYHPNTRNHPYHQTDRQNAVEESLKRSGIDASQGCPYLRTRSLADRNKIENSLPRASVAAINQRPLFGIEVKSPHIISMTHGGIIMTSKQDDLLSLRVVDERWIDSGIWTKSACSTPDLAPGFTF